MGATSDPIIGIDLGTTNSLVAYCDEAGPRVLASAEGESNLPSVVRLSVEDGSVGAIGEAARRHAVEYPTQTIFSVKRLMGRGMADVADELDYLPYAVVEGEQDTARVQVGERVWSPQEISAMFLRELKQRAESALGCEVKRAVITVPAYFDDAQRQATRDAGRLAGLQVVRMVNEPTAAALAYGIGVKAESNPATKNKDGSISLSTKFNPDACFSQDSTAAGDGDNDDANTQTETVAVYDLGGGTFDISILRLTQTEQGTVDQVLSTAGDTHLGGDDVDRMIVELIQKEIREQFGESLTFPASTQQAFRNFAEATKIKLSQDESASIEIAIGEGQTYQRSITRDELNAMIEPWVQRTMDCCQRALQAAKLSASEIDRVVMVGGSTRIPAVQQAVREQFEVEPYTALNPDEVVALGAAVQASILAGINRDMLLLDVIPLSLGLETMGGAVAKLITANTTIPARATEFFTTYADNQTAVQINVYQGERELVEDCRLLGRFELKGIPPMPAGLAKVEVTFLVDANGILTVEAIEQRSGKRASIQVIPNHGLTRDEIAKIEEASLTHAREDMTAHRLIDLRNQSRMDIKAIRQQLAKVGDALPNDEREVIEQQVQVVEDFVKAERPDTDAFHQALDAMDKQTVRLAELAIAQTLREA